jgi:YbbR domain-containing protein
MEQLDLQPDTQMQTTPTTGRTRRRPHFQMADVATLALSVGLALTIWLIAVNQENPLVVQELGTPLPLTIVGLQEGLEVVQDLSTESVALELRAPRSSWDNMRDGDFRAMLDLTGLEAGEHDVSVRVTRRDPQVTVLDVQRPEYTVTIDRRAEKEVPVQIEVMDGAAFGYEWLQPIYTPMTVTVRGPESQVEQVVRARAEIFLRSAKSQVERTQQLIPVDAQNREVDRIEVAAPGRVQIVVPVEQWPGRKEVAVRVKLSGPPAAGYRLSAVRSDPSTVVLQGDPDLLSQVPGFVETEPLDLTGATTDVRKRVGLILPDGVTSFDGDFVMATAGITPIVGGITVSEPLVLRGLGPGLTADTALEEVDVILSGPIPLLESMNNDDVFAILDLTGLVAGTHIVVPAIVAPDGIQKDAVIPETVEVVIRLRDVESSNDLQQVPDVEATATTPMLTTPTATPAPPSGQVEVEAEGNSQPPPTSTQAP